ncbi:MAG TPA: hypothetical protein VF660_00630 [Actinomycetota bacterium]
MESTHGTGGERRSPEGPEPGPTNESRTAGPANVRPIEERLHERLGRAQTSFEGQLSGLLKQLRTPLKQVEEWVSRGDLQSVVDQLQEKAQRAQEEVERRLHALDEVRQGLEVHVRKQLEEFRRERQDVPDGPQPAAAEPAGPQAVVPVAVPPETAPKTTAGPKTKKPRARKPQKSPGP